MRPFKEAQQQHRHAPHAHASPEALARGGAGRLVQSLTSYLACGLFSATSVSGRSHTLEDLIAIMLRAMRRGARASLGSDEVPLHGAVVGRPVRFVNSDGEADEALAQKRLTVALNTAGFENVRLEDEPVGAACFRESPLDYDELVLIGDFGCGTNDFCCGTNDFCLMRVGPSSKGIAAKQRMLGAEGAGRAGDAFDSEIVERVVSPYLGRGSEYHSYVDGKVLPVPPRN